MKLTLLTWPILGSILPGPRATADVLRAESLAPSNQQRTPVLAERYVQGELCFTEQPRIGGVFERYDGRPEGVRVVWLICSTRRSNWQDGPSGYHPNERSTTVHGRLDRTEDVG